MFDPAFLIFAGCFVILCLFIAITWAYDRGRADGYDAGHHDGFRQGGGRHLPPFDR